MSKPDRHRNSSKANIRQQAHGKDTQMHLERHREAPLPDPAEMQAYKDIDPDLPAQIFKMAKDEQDHRHVMDRYVLKQAVRNNIRNNLAALLGVVIICGVGVCFLLYGKPEDGAHIIMTCSVAMAGVFVVRRLTEGKAKE